MENFAAYWWNNFIVGWGFGNSIIGVLQMGLGVVVLFWWLKKGRKEEVRWEGFVLKLLTLVFVGITLFTTIFVAPYVKQAEAISQRDLAQNSHSNNLARPLRVISSNEDKQARGQLERTMAELSQTKAALTNAQERILELDPKRQAIASVSISVVATFEAKVRSVRFFGGGRIILVGGNKAVVDTFADEYNISGASNSVTVRITTQPPSEAAIVGKPISLIADADYIQIELAQRNSQNPIPDKSRLVEGSATILINNSITIKFDIPIQPLKMFPGSDTNATTQMYYLGLTGIQSKLRSELIK